MLCPSIEFGEIGAYRPRGFCDCLWICEIARVAFRRILAAAEHPHENRGFLHCLRGEGCLAIVYCRLNRYSGFGRDRGLRKLATSIGHWHGQDGRDYWAWHHGRRNRPQPRRTWLACDRL